MPNFAPVTYLDPFEVAASLRTRWGSFRRREDGMSLLPVRGAPENADDPDDEAGFGFYKRAGVRSGKWPEMKTLLDRIERLGEGQEFGRVWLELYPAGYRGRWELDDSAYGTRFSRAYLALRWNPQATLFAGTEWQVLTPGWVTLVNHRAPRSALNGGEWDAVALVIDGRKREAAEC
jgi:hypothetical protein